MKNAAVGVGLSDEIHELFILDAAGAEAGEGLGAPADRRRVRPVPIGEDGQSRPASELTRPYQHLRSCCRRHHQALRICVAVLKFTLKFEIVLRHGTDVGKKGKAKNASRKESSIATFE